ncbi:MAG TPA: carboxypeptidase regulatory-like domain-containing protein, partial [Terracidiphilus sp.]|nr:carboxypeptidase regulatory-like domain-containing protein [Terracidiphilus sp.]
MTSHRNGVPLSATTANQAATVGAAKSSAILTILVFAIGLFACSAPAAYGQAFGTISGEVTDPSGAAIPNAQVTATETGTGVARPVTTDARGHYVIPNLRPTQYTISVNTSGFQKSAQTVTLLANQSATVDFRLHVGSAQQTVTVTGAAPLVNTTNNMLGGVIGSTRMIDLPLNGRNAVQSMNLIPGVSGANPPLTTGQGTPVGSTTVNVNGSRDNQTNYSLDGANFLDQYYNVNVPFPFPDALQEFSVQTDNYSARYGENAGGVVNVVTKSGTNKFHGDLFEFVRNPIFDARPYFAKTRDQLKLNQFGGTVGGPIWKNRTFFFFGYQRETYRDVTTASSFVPTAAELKGDFSAISKPIINPATGTAYPGNQIPTTSFDPAALTIATKYLPQVGGNGQVFYTQPTSQNINQYTVRVDEHISSKDSLMGRYFSYHIILQPQNPPGNLLGYSAGYDQPFKNVMIQETHTFRSNLLNQASFTLSDVPTSKTFTPNSPSPATFGVKGLWLPSSPWIQNISINGSFSINGGAKGPFNNRDYGVQDNLSWVLGRNDINLGLDYTHSSVDLGDQFEAQGAFNFTSDVTNNQIASFLLGYLHEFRQGYGEYKNNRDNFWGFYANDDFHATRKLTLNFGLRYEPYFPWKEIKGRVEQFSIANYNAGVKSQKYPNAPPGLLFAGDRGVPFDGVKGTFTDFSPRLGFAYDLTGNGRTSIRGGVGMFYDTQTAGVINNRFADISPFSPQVDLTPPPGPFSNPIQGYTGYYPFPFTYPPASNTQFTLPLLVITYNPTTNFQVPVTYEYNLAVEHQFAGNWMLQAAYAGSQSRHEKETIQLNPAQYAPGATTKTTDARRIFAPYYGTIDEDGQDINANFNALEAVLKKQSSWLNLTIAYTFSKSLDDAPNGGNNNDIGSDSNSALPWTNPDRHRFDYGPSGFDHTHRLVASYVWNLPALGKQNG